VSHSEVRVRADFLLGSAIVAVSDAKVEAAAGEAHLARLRCTEKKCFENKSAIVQNCL
jgi:hypothetical protein